MKQNIVNRGLRFRIFATGLSVLSATQEQHQIIRMCATANDCIYTCRFNALNVVVSYSPNDTIATSSQLVTDCR